MNDQEIERIARVCLAVNAPLCESFGDNSQVPWADAPQWRRDSAVKGVRFALDNPDAPDSAQHDAWAADKRADGWVYGTKDAGLKTHPCLVAFDQLPREQKAKDALFRAVVRAMTTEG